MMLQLDHAAASQMQGWLGIDVSAATFNASFLVARNGKEKEWQRELPNGPAGFTKLLRWVESKAPGLLASHTCHFCMEATGAYSQALALFLAEAGQPVSVVNPAYVRYAGLSQGAANKTDPADARAIARYARKETPALWRASQPEVRALVALMRRLESLKTHLVQEKNRLGVPGVPGLIPAIRNSLKKSIAFLEREIAGLEKEIGSHIDRHPGLKSDKELLLSIPGIGEVCAHWVLAELPDVSQFPSAEAAAAYAGLNPKEHRSGTSVRRKTRISKAGNKHLRKALYMPAMSAARFNPAVRALYDRLIARAMLPKAALIAAMRKLLMIAYGVLKSRQKFTYKTAEITA
jgi:transposase